jgi:hypothetical protein
MQYKRISSVSVLAIGLMIGACYGDDDATVPDSGSGSGGNADAGVVPEDPSPPTLGQMIDRIGRAAISTALIAPIEADTNAKGARKSAYNAAGPTGWGEYTGDIKGSLAVYDSLDAVCGNQLLVATASMAAGAYDTLGGALTDDKLYVNSAGSTCTQYLAVEANATNVVPNTDCGGRTPNYDVIDTTYSVLAIGALSGVGDGVGADNVTHSDTAFPWLAAP